MFSWQRECTISTRSHARNNDYCSSKLFSKSRDVASFLEMFNTWWTVSNSKKMFSPNILEMLWSMGTKKNCVFKNFGRWGSSWCIIKCSFLWWTFLPSNSLADFVCSNLPILDLIVTFIVALSLPVKTSATRIWFCLCQPSRQGI